MLKFNNRTLKYNNRWLNGDEIPINLPANTVRLRYRDGIIPTAYHTFPGTTLTQISTIPNIWDITHVDPSYPTEWHYLFQGGYYSIDGNPVGYGYGYGLLEVIAANVSNITNMTGTFMDCDSLYKVCNLNTSKVTSANDMFGGCENLIQVGSINLSQIEHMRGMFYGCSKLSVIPNITLPAYTYANNGKIKECQQLFQNCYNISSGALDLYNRLTHTYSAAGQTKCLVDLRNNFAHMYCFRDCGRDTTTGAAELAQIPDGWK